MVGYPSAQSAGSLPMVVTPLRRVVLLFPWLMVHDAQSGAPPPMVELQRGAYMPPASMLGGTVGSMVGIQHPEV